jgi:hypothetical protein
MNILLILLAWQVPEYLKNQTWQNRKLIMKFFKIRYTTFCTSVLFISCSVFKTSMTPTELYTTLPTMTKSKFLKEDEIQIFDCTCLKKNRNYTAPMGLTVKNDLRYGAKGIDEWVSLDKGNAYVVKNYKWMTVGYDSKNASTATQLYIEFDTYNCR